MLLSAQQIQDWDAYTIAHEPIASIDLMERAAAKCVQWLSAQFYSQQSFHIFCGKGNNGGDGLAIARLLLEKGSDVTVYVLEFGAKGTEDFQLNLQRLHTLTPNIHFIQSAEFFPSVSREDIVIDALFGSGLNRPLQELSAALVNHINLSEATVIAIDVPSGMFIDKSSLGNTIIKARDTLTFQSLKFCLLLAENAPFFGYVHVLDIGLLPAFLEEVQTQYSLLLQQTITGFLKERFAFSHKGHHGHALLIAGNYGKMGAALLAAKAAVRTGTGLLTMYIPGDMATVMHTSLPEAMVLPRERSISVWDAYACVGAGPGLGTDEASEQTLYKLLYYYHQPIVLDADALNILSQHPEWWHLVPKNAVLTPHPKEFERMFGPCANEVERIEKAIAVSKEQEWIIVLKGHHSFIACDGKGYFNITGNAGLAKGGSGDVLTGMITGLLAQKHPPLEAALLGVYLHGLAADLALENQSMESLIPSDVTEAIGKAYVFVRGN
ncbi:MAG: NAD(P)H-hydrate dehydratase [Bacteroidota bacterium]|nr:NAD(P)H-hydrate dehydratase [Bacteroidota bacterium]